MIYHTSLRLDTSCFAGIGLGAAIQFLNDIGMDQIVARENDLLNMLSELNKMEGVQIIGQATNKASDFFLLDGIHPTDAGTIMDKEGIAIRMASLCNPLWIILQFQAH